MALLNYSTTVDAYKTVSEIEWILAKHGARSILKEYGERGEVCSLAFIIRSRGKDIPVRLPIRTKECMAVMKRDKQKNPQMKIKCTEEQAEKVAWRIMKDWIEAQMALLETEMVKFEEIFLPYIQISDTRTVYDVVEEKQFLLEEKDNI